MKRNLSTAEKVQNERAVISERNIYADVYQALKEVELQTIKTSVSVADLKKASAKTVAEIIGQIENENAKIQAKNLETLNNAFANWFTTKCNYSHSEKRVFLHAIWIARKITHNFALTFQSEKTDETTNTYESGAFFARPTTISAAGIRTSFNSVEYTRRTAAQIAEKERKAKELATAKAILLQNGLPQAVIDNMPTTAIIATAKAFEA